jgi:hypothetical protein
MSSSGGGSSSGGHDILFGLKKASQRFASVVADTGAKTLLKVRYIQKVGPRWGGEKWRSVQCARVCV